MFNPLLPRKRHRNVFDPQTRQGNLEDHLPAQTIYPPKKTKTITQEPQERLPKCSPPSGRKIVTKKK